MINELKLDKRNETFAQYNISDSDSLLFTGLKKINVFVGANNSGKSRLLRELFRTFSAKEIDNIDGNGFSHLDFPFIDSNKVDGELDVIIKSYLEDVPPDSLKAQKEILKKFKVIKSKNNFDGMISFSEFAMVLNKFKSISATETKEYKIKNEKLQNITYSVYIPVLRGLKKISGNAPLKARIHDDYFKELDFGKLNIFTGEELYKTLKEAKNSPEDEREKIKEFEDFLGNTFFKSAVELIPLEFLGKDNGRVNIKNHNEDIYIKIGKEPEFSISDIGDGIQSLIILTFQLFLHADKNLFLFIEEPELNLHPGLQRLFLETLNNEMFKNTQVIFTTHSNHFLDLAIETNSETAIFSFEKKPVNKNKDKPQFKITNITERALFALSLLGVNSSSVFLSNCTIWVEGISDRLFIRKYLDLYQRTENYFLKYREDTHYSFVEYAGDNITHWSFLDVDDNNESINYQYISRSIFLITDKDKGKELRHEKLKSNLGNNYYCLECLEIENLLNPDILKSTINKYRKKGNEQIKFKKFKLEDYYDKDIGEFIYSSIITNEKQINQIAPKPSGNGGVRKIKDKYKFAKNAIDNILSWDDMSDDAQKLTKRIYQFIEKNNKP